VITSWPRYVPALVPLGMVIVSFGFKINSSESAVISSSFMLGDGVDVRASTLTKVVRSSSLVIWWFWPSVILVFPSGLSNVDWPGFMFNAEAGIVEFPESNWKSVVPIYVFHGVVLFWTKIIVPRSCADSLSWSNENSCAGKLIVSLGMNRKFNSGVADISASTSGVASRAFNRIESVFTL